MENQTQPSASAFEAVLASLQETSKLQKENERLFKEQMAELRQSWKEADEKAEKARQESDARAEKARTEAEKARKEAEKARKESDARAEKARQKSDARSEKLKADFWKTHKALQKELGGVSNSNGAVAESYFINSFSKSMSFAGQEYDAIDSNLKRKVKKLNLQAEYDLVLYNCKSIVIIEIKYKADKDNVGDLLRKAPVFKQLFPQYLNYDFYLGLAALHFDSETEKESIKHGIAIIKQVGKSMVINDAHLKVF
jgi:flagellar biosynthesis GTPase FlhF